MTEQEKKELEFVIKTAVKVGILMAVLIFTLFSALYYLKIIGHG
jgi:hypothetical protein